MPCCCGITPSASTPFYLSPCANAYCGNVTPCYSATGSPQIGIPSQTPGTNPSTTTTPSPQGSSSFLGSLGNIGAQWLSTVAKASVAPGSQIQRAVYGNNAFSSLTTGGGLILVIAAAIVLVLIFRK